ncbi:hypothetical protein VP01_1931g2 [Puccinia sorghi]|uniref:Uncharacterized protein n=1 Tax=Puccinia sorghi TaxID=27349 RepID=A0A0L6VE93_9BASI|nr:hypothetical protein VP01_1931g2 [Puccinia sorghi]
MSVQSIGAGGSWTKGWAVKSHWCINYARLSHLSPSLTKPLPQGASPREARRRKHIISCFVRTKNNKNSCHKLYPSFLRTFSLTHHLHQSYHDQARSQLKEGLGNSFADLDTHFIHFSIFQKLFQDSNILFGSFESTNQRMVDSADQPGFRAHADGKPPPDQFQFENRSTQRVRIFLPRGKTTVIGAKSPCFLLSWTTMTGPRCRGHQVVSSIFCTPPRTSQKKLCHCHKLNPHNFLNDERTSSAAWLRLPTDIEIRAAKGGRQRKTNKKRSLKICQRSVFRVGVKGRVITDLLVIIHSITGACITCSSTSAAAFIINFKAEKGNNTEKGKRKLTLQEKTKMLFIHTYGHVSYVSLNINRLMFFSVFSSPLTHSITHLFHPF